MRSTVNLRALAIQIVVTFLIFALALFIPAGTMAWPAGWAFLALQFGFTVGISLWLWRFNPDLLAERMTGIGRPDQKRWDKVLLVFVAVAYFAWLVLMALDAVRFRWSQMTGGIRALGLMVLLCSFYLFYLTFRENPYLSPAVRLQADRAQTVVATGPYRHVRHPMYAGFLLYTLGTAGLLGSWYGVLGGLVLVGIVARRAVLEERVLAEELEGYRTYQREVRYRLVPYLW